MKYTYFVSYSTMDKANGNMVDGNMSITSDIEIVEYQTILDMQEVIAKRLKQEFNKDNYPYPYMGTAVIQNYILLSKQ